MSKKKREKLIPPKHKLTEFLEHSNAIEGVYDNDSLFDAERAWDYLMGVEKLTINVILQTHKILMKRQPLREDEVGFFRRVPVWVGQHEMLNPYKILDALEIWLDDVETSLRVPGRLGHNMKLDHIEYERIHPFVDGNGRTGRLFLNWARVQVGLPLLIIHKGEEQQDYYKWFKKKHG